VADTLDELGRRFPVLPLVRVALEELEAAHKVADAMPTGIVKTKAKGLIKDARAALERLERVCRHAERFEENAAQHGITVPRGVGRHAKN
jgi:hypothetical protein